MAKTITVNVTLHVKDDEKSRPFKYDNNGGLISGRHVVTEVPPGTPVLFESDAEADRMVARFDGRIVSLPPAIVVNAVAAEDHVELVQKLALPASGAASQTDAPADGSAPAEAGSSAGPGGKAAKTAG